MSLWVSSLDQMTILQSLASCWGTFVPAGGVCMLSCLVEILLCLLMSLMSCLCLGLVGNS